MNLSAQNALQIVTEISAILQQHVNLMDERGIIVASTNPDRMNTYHGGAAKVIAKHLPELIILNDEQYEGSRKGINLPVVLNDKIVGVIGLTGEYEEVVKYGQVIKKMTEILLRENLMNQQKKVDERIRTRFLDDWILDGATVTPGFIERGLRLGLDASLLYRVLVGCIADIKKYSDTPEGQETIDRINRRIRGMVSAAPNQIFTKTPSRIICLFPAKNMSDISMFSAAQNIQKIILEEFDIRLLMGIDASAGTAHLAYLQAAKAAQACAAQPKKGVCFYSELDLELFLDEISTNSKMEFVKRIFCNVPEKEMQGWVHLLQVYFSVNGSISLAGEQLYLHKNTLQYKLKRLWEITGNDPRNILDATRFALAIEFYTQLSE